MKYKPIEMTWKYEGNCFQSVLGCDSWVLVMDGTEEVARLRRYDSAFMDRVDGIGPYSLLHKVEHRGLLPWPKLDRELDKSGLFELSDNGVTSVDLYDVWDPDYNVVRIERGPGGSFRKISDREEDVANCPLDTN